MSCGRAKRTWMRTWRASHFTTIFGKAKELLAEPLEVNLLTELQ